MGTIVYDVGSFDIDELITISTNQEQATAKYFYHIKAMIKYDYALKSSTSQFISSIEKSYTNPIDDSANIQTVFFTGIGKNETIALKSANMLRSLNFNSNQICAVNAMHGDMGMIRDGDTIVAISKSGNTQELIHFLTYVKKFREITIIGITVGLKSNAAFKQCCDHIIDLPKVKEICNWNLVPTMSIISTQLYIDMIAVYVANKLALSRAKFIESHPGGSIGSIL